MKIRKEAIDIEPGRSFKLFSPSLRDHFFWHYHAEIELVYVEAAAGIRHVGSHVSGYSSCDLVLIGPNVPHLNFDYGLRTEYSQIVVQFHERFLQDDPMAEWQSIRRLLERSSKGLAFHGATRDRAVRELKTLFDMNAFDSLLGVLRVLRELADSDEVTELNTEDTAVKQFLNDKIRMGTVYDYIGKEYDQHPDVNRVAQLVHLSTPAFCRYFKRQTNMTFTDFVNQYRIGQAKTLLLKGDAAASVGYQVGFASVSHFNKLFRRLTGETPLGYRRKFGARGR